MKRILKLLVILTLAVLCLALFACGFGGSSDRRQKQELYAPNNFYYNEETDVLSFMPMQLAVGYRLEINGALVPQILPASEFSFADYQGERYTVRAQSVASGNDYWVDSPWSEYFNFVKPHELSFEKNGGEGNADTVRVYTGEPFQALPVLTKTGYTFGGWYYYENLSGEEVTAETTVQPQVKTLYAKFIPSIFIVAFGFNDMEVTYGSYYGELPVATVREGYDFVGYFSEEYGLGEQITSESVVTVTEFTRFYPYYAPKSYLAFLDVNGGVPLENDAVSVNFDRLFTLPTASRTGYYFDGWYFNSERLTASNGMSINVWSRLYNENLTAKWTAKTYSVEFAESGAAASCTITFDLNYVGSPAPTRQIITAFNFLTYPSVPARSGYIFAGWYGDTGGTQTFNFSNNVTQDRTLYAKWYQTANSVHNGFNAIQNVNFGTTSMSYLNWNAVSSEAVRLYAFVLLRPQEVTFTAQASGSGRFYAYLTDSSGTGSIDYIASYQTSITQGYPFTHTYKNLSVGVLYYVRLTRPANQGAPDVSFTLSGNSGINIPTANGKIPDLNIKSVTYDGELPEITKPNGTGTFKGYYTEENGQGICVYDENCEPKLLKWEIDEESLRVTLLAWWE